MRPVNDRVITSFNEYPAESEVEGQFITEVDVLEFVLLLGSGSVSGCSERIVGQCLQ